MKKFFTKDFWNQEEAQPRWQRWMNEFFCIAFLIEMFGD